MTDTTIERIDLSSISTLDALTDAVARYRAAVDAGRSPAFVELTEDGPMIRGRITDHEWHGRAIAGLRLDGVDLPPHLDLSRCRRFEDFSLSGSNAPSLRVGGALLTSFRAEDSTLRGFHAPSVHLPQAWMTGCDLSGACFAHANLAGANLRGSNLSNADLRHADLRSANLTDVDLRGADLTGARFDGAALVDARFLWSDDFKVDVLALLRASFRERALPAKVLRDAMRFDASCYGNARAFDVWKLNGRCPFGGEQGTERAITFGESSGCWIDEDGDRIASALLGDLTDDRRIPSGTPNPLALLARLLLAHGCTIEVRSYRGESATLGPIDEDSIDADSLTSALALLAPPRVSRFRVDVRRRVRVVGYRDDYATVEVEADSEDDARDMVESDPSDYVSEHDWSEGDADDFEDDDVDEVEVDEVREID